MMINQTLMTSSLKFWLKKKPGKPKKSPMILAKRKRLRKPKRRNQPLKKLSCDRNDLD